MAPHPLTPFNGSFVNDSNSVKFSSSSSSDAITTSIFGLFALAVGIVTIWQGHRAYKLLHAARYTHAFELEGASSLMFIRFSNFSLLVMKAAIALDREEQVSDASDDGSSLDLSLDPLSTTTPALDNDSRVLDTGDADAI